MGTTRSLVYETADARNVGREMPSLEMLMHISLFSGLVLSPSLFAYQSAWRKEADELIEGERLARKANGKVY